MEELKILKGITLATGLEKLTAALEKDGYAVKKVGGGYVGYSNDYVPKIADIKTAVSEAVTNCIVHAYKDTYGKIFITGKLYDDNTVKIIIRDKGCGIVDVSEAMTPLFTTGEGDRAGLGFTVMESFCDKITVKSKLTFGTTVTLTKKIEGKSKW